MRIKSLLILLLMPFYSIAQVMITGKVLNLDTKKPVIAASVFLNNAIAANKTNEDGTFTLFNVKPGRYTLVVTTIGYQTYTQTLTIGNSIALPVIFIEPKTIMLKEVKIRATSMQYFDDFKALFLGPTANAKQCTILNPEVLDINFDKTTRTYTATSEDFIKIENKALGYLIRYKLTTFTYEQGGSFYYEGLSVFEDLPGTDKQKSKWSSKRQVAYLGSSMHFLRSLIADKTDAEGFKVQQLIRKPNPNYQADKDMPGAKYIQSLYEMKKEDLFERDTSGLFSLNFKNNVIVTYVKGTSKMQIAHLLEASACPLTVLTLKKPFVLFDSNGTLTDKGSIVYDGEWSTCRIAELLPVDYSPE